VVSFNGPNGVVGELQLDVLILNDYVGTQTSNGLALFYGKRVNFSPYIRAASKFKYLNSTL